MNTGMDGHEQRPLLNNGSAEMIYRYIIMHQYVFLYQFSHDTPQHLVLYKKDNNDGIVKILANKKQNVSPDVNYFI